MLKMYFSSSWIVSVNLKDVIWSEDDIERIACLLLCYVAPS